jgi:hypothetical protein
MLATAAVALCAFLLAPVAARAADDGATPKGAAEAFFKALETGDAAKAKSLAAGDAKQMELLDLLVPLVGNFKKMEQAAVKKWGDEGKKLLSGPGGSQAFDIEGEMKNAKVEETGDTATITPAKKEEGKNAEPMKLKKIGGKWKIDMAAMPNAEQMDNPQAKKMFGAMSDVAKGMIADIDGGKFKTVADAQQGFQQKMLAAMMAAAGEGGVGQPGGAGAGAGQPPKDK